MKDEYDYTRFTHEFYEYEQGQKNILVKGRLKKHLSFWRNIGASAFILDVIENGYKIPLFSNPCRSFCKNNRSALNESIFVSEAIQDLLDRALIEKCTNPTYIVNPLTVSIQNSGKKRLILDLRLVNKHLWKQSIKNRPLVNKWRGEGKLVSMFLDDGFACAQEYEKTKTIGQDIKNDILKSGFVPNATKSIWVPVQILEFLGVVLDAIQGTIYIPDRRILKAKESISDLLLSFKGHRKVSVRKVASVVGQLISMSVVLGHISQIMTKYLSADILNAKYWDSYIYLCDESRQQLLFWDRNLQVLNTKDIYESHKCTRIVYSDASASGYAGYEVSTINGISHGIWSEEESLKSSTWRELVAVYRILLSLRHVLANQRVKWFTDNQGVKAISSKGSMKRDLQDIAFGIFKLCMSKSIYLEMEWIPRTENEKADYLSKIVDFDDWGISFAILVLLQRRFGQFQVDWFASDYNAKLPKFYSRFWNPSCFGIDAFAESWGGQYGLFVPPIAVIYRVIKKMVTDKAYGVLIIPCWKSAVFWPFLCPSGRFRKEIVDWIDLPTEKQYYIKCKNGKGIFGNTDLHFRMIALRIDFR